MKKRLLLLLLAFFTATCLFACDTAGDDNENTGGSADAIKVILAVDEGAQIIGESVVNTTAGKTVRFKVKLSDTCVLKSLSHGQLVNENSEPTEGLGAEEVYVCVEGLRKDTVVKLFTENLGYDTTATYRLYFSGDGSDTTSIANKSAFNAGTSLTLEAGNKDMKFIGWSIGSATLESDKCISTERSFNFRVSNKHVNDDGVLRLFANYTEPNSFFYDPNGGNIDMSTPQTAENDYYSAQIYSGKLKLLIDKEYLSVFECPAFFYDDNTFTRDGYVLAEFNTKPDGSGEGYSLGSRFYLDKTSGRNTVFYCIWKKASDAADFTYTAHTDPCPTTEAKAPLWASEGVMITSYRGDDKEIVIPEFIDGKPVIGIAAGAFVNKTATSLVLSKYIQTVEQGAFQNCSLIEKVYYPDSIYRIYNESFDEASYSSLKRLYVNATMAPRYSNTDSGAFAVKLSRLLAEVDENKIIVIAGSSTYQGLSSEYMEALLDGEYRVVNFGTTRTTNCIIYLEAMAELAGEGDIVIYAPENSTYMVGENELYWKTVRDMECLYNFYRYVDISEYTNVFGALCDFNVNYRYTRSPSTYEAAYKVITEKKSVNVYGEYQNKKRVGLVENYVDTYFITMNKRYKSKYEGQWDDADGQITNKDYTDPENVTWASIDTPYLRYHMNRAIASAKSGGAKVYFSFCPVDADKLVDEARNIDWLLEYDKLIAEIYDFDGVIGSCIDYVFAHKYFYDCAFHPNDLGRSYRTYRLYSDLCEMLGIEKNGFDSKGTDFEGCIFTDDGYISESGYPFTSVDYLD